MTWGIVMSHMGWSDLTVHVKKVTGSLVGHQIQQYQGSNQNKKQKQEPKPKLKTKTKSKAKKQNQEPKLKPKLQI